MDTKDDDVGTTFNEDLAALNWLLTAMARRTYLRGDGSEERHDFGEVVSIAVTTAAANLGSVDALLAGHPESGEADYVRQIVLRSTPEDELHLHRTAPVRLVLDPEAVFEDIGLYALFEEDDDDLSQDYSDGGETAADKINDKAIDTRRHAMEAIYLADLTSYFAAYVNVLGQIMTERGFTVPVEVGRVKEYRTEPDWDTLAEDLHTEARERTPLPSGIALKDYPGDVADAERAANRTYADRLRALNES